MSGTFIRQRDPASFRDPDGFVFQQDGGIYRYISPGYYPEYKRLRGLGLYDELIDKEYLIPFEEVEKEMTSEGEALIIKPFQVPFISYPYEWTFGQLKEAAKLTLEIQKIALQYGVQLKDASSYNVQFIGSKPVFIDTLSFEHWNGEVMWRAYKQFCEHFLAPLTLCSFCDPRMKSLFVSNLDGIPLDLAKCLISKKAYLYPPRFLHLWLHEFFQKVGGGAKKTAESGVRNEPKKPSSSAFGLVDSLLSSIKDLKRKNERSVWKAYYQDNSYPEEAFAEKQNIVDQILSNLRPKMLWDLGANNGLFTEMVCEYCEYSVALDFDLTCVEIMYERVRREGNESVLPLHIDIGNPSPGIGWESKERKSFIERGPCDAAMALALVHHLLVSSAIPLPNIVTFFQKICRDLIIEYVPPSDTKFREICQTNPNDFSFFTEEAFVLAFSTSFILEARIPIGKSARVIYHFKRREI